LYYLRQVIIVKNLFCVFAVVIAVLFCPATVSAEVSTVRTIEARIEAESIAYDELEYEPLDLESSAESVVKVRVKNTGTTFFYLQGADADTAVTIKSVKTGEEKSPFFEDYGVYQSYIFNLTAGDYLVRISSIFDSSVSWAAYTLPSNIELNGKSKTFYCTSNSDWEIILRINLKKNKRVSFKARNQTWELSVKEQCLLYSIEEDGSLDLLKQGSISEFQKVNLLKGSYYLRLTGVSQDVIRIKYSTKSIVNKAKKSYKNVVGVKVGGYRRAAFFCSGKDSSTKWFKFRNRDSEPKIISIDGNTDSTITVYFMDKDFRSFGYVVFPPDSKPVNAKPTVTKIANGVSTEYLPEGLYFVKIVRESDNGSASLKIAFN